MAKTNVSTKFDISAALNRFLGDSDIQDIGNAITEEARALIASGQSPVDGVGRFVAYKGVAQSRAFAGTKRGAELAKSSGAYPYSVMKKYPGKQVRPVNLELSGDMLDSLSFRALPQNVGIEWGILNSANEAVKVRAKANNEGTATIPQRQFIPGEGQTFTTSIIRRIIQVYSARLRAILEESSR